MKPITCRTTVAAISGVCIACAMMAAVTAFAPANAIAQSISRNQNHKSGMGGASASPFMGSSGGMGASSQGGGFGRSSGASAGGFGSASGSSGFGQHGSGSSTMGSGAGGGSHSLGGMAGSSGSHPGSSGGKAPKLKLKPASEATADSSSTHSMYDYNYGADDTGRNADSIYKSRADTTPTDNYKFGATDPR
jgi:hypothetical protein